MNKQEAFNQFLANQEFLIPIDIFIINFLAAALLSFLLGKLYERFGKSMSNRKAFASNFVMITVTTMIIITIVKSSLALSLGLVGALSIVRYRTAIKEPEELSYLFFSISIGLGIGANQLIPTIIGFILISIVILLKSIKNNDHLSATTIIITNDNEKIKLENCTEILSNLSRKIELKRFQSAKSEFEAVFMLEVDEAKNLQEIQEKLRLLSDDVSVQYIENT